MTAPLDTSIPRKRLPQWTGGYRNFWIDSFAEFSQILVGARASAVGDFPYDDDDSEGGIATASPGETIESDFLTEEEVSIYEEDIELAARLADRAVQELQYRFAIQKGPKRKRR